MRIAIVYPSFSAVGGAENVVIWLAESLVQRGHHVSLYTHEFSESIWGPKYNRPYTVCLIDFKKRRSTLETNRIAGKALQRLLRLSLYDFDVITPHNYPASLWVYYARQKRMEFPAVLLYMHNLARNFYEKLIDTHYRQLPDLGHMWNRYRPKKMFRSLRQSLFNYRGLDKAAVLACDRVLANSKYTADLAKAIYGIEVNTCPLGVSFERYRIQIEKALQNSGSRKGYSIVTVARLEIQKNIDTILKAVKILKGENILPLGFQYIVAGDGPYRNSLMNKCKALGITDVVRFVGAVSHDTVWTLYAEAAFMVHIPLDEPFGLVPLEAALMKKTCIVSDHGGPAYTVDNGVTGFHVDALDPENVAQKMEYLLTNSDRALAMGAAAYKKVIENMSWDVFVDNYENHLKQVCGTRQFCR